MSEKLTPIEIKTRRENLNLSVKEICKIFKISIPTWKKWEEKPLAPYFVGFALSHLERTIDEKRGVKTAKRAGHNTKKPYNLSFRGRFLAKTEKSENGICLLWTGANSIRHDGGFVSPRQAAWIVEKGERAEAEIKLVCETENCVNIEHFELGAPRSSGRKTITEDLKNLIRFELAKPNNIGVKKLATKFNVSAGTVSRLKNE